MPKYVFNPFTAKLDIQASTKSDVGLSNVDNVQQIPLSYLDTDGTLSANSDTKVASQKATKTYADQLIGAANALVYKGVIDCSANPNYPAADAGHMYIVSVAGKIGGASGVNVEVGDMIICNTDGTPSGDQATVGANFNIIEKNIEGAVSGPASAVTNNVATFDGVTGKIIKDSGVALGTLASQNGTFSGGGTLATGGYTLTVPATGTAALLGTANTFTAAQEINGNLTVDTNTLFVDAVANRVGIGIATPAHKFHVSGSSSSIKIESTGALTHTFAEITGVSSGRVRLGATGSTTNNRNFEFTSRDNSLQFSSLNDNWSAYVSQYIMVMLAGGNVGIGTTSPSELLELSKSTSYQLRLTNLGTGGGYWNIGQTNNNFSAGGGKLVFVPDSTSSNAATVTFTNTGKVGIGTTSPATSGLLDLTSTTGALIVPRMTTTQRNALTAVNGMIIYNTTTNTMQGRINGAWTDM